jgi:benzodiazapine receptor
MKKWLKLIISLLIPFLASIIGSFFTTNSVSTWYLTLNKPFFNPPSWIFGPVWTLLYLLMGIALYLIWTAKTENKKYAYIFFGIQIFLNAFWSILIRKLFIC